MMCWPNITPQLTDRQLKNDISNWFLRAASEILEAYGHPYFCRTLQIGMSRVVHMEFYNSMQRAKEHMHSIYPPAPALAGATRLGSRPCPITYHQSLSIFHHQSAIDQSAVDQSAVCWSAGQQTGVKYCLLYPLDDHFTTNLACSLSLGWP